MGMTMTGRGRGGTAFFCRVFFCVFDVLFSFAFSTVFSTVFFIITHLPPRDGKTALTAPGFSLSCTQLALASPTGLPLTWLCWAPSWASPPCRTWSASRPPAPRSREGSLGTTTRSGPPGSGHLTVHRQKGPGRQTAPARRRDERHRTNSHSPHRRVIEDRRSIRRRKRTGTERARAT